MSLVVRKNGEKGSKGMEITDDGINGEKKRKRRGDEKGKVKKKNLTAKG